MEGWDDHVIFCFLFYGEKRRFLYMYEGQIHMWGFVLVPDLHSEDILASNK
jgi:hypothetical protein